MATKWPIFRRIVAIPLSAAWRDDLGVGGYCESRRGAIIALSGQETASPARSIDDAHVVLPWRPTRAEATANRVKISVTLVDN
jgi:hypothetical protein